MAEVDVNALTGGDLDVPVKVQIYDTDEPGKRDFMGEFEISIKELLATKRKDAIDMKLDGKRKTGEIYVEGAKIAPQDSVSQQAMKAMNVVATAELARWVIQNKIKAARQTAAKKEQAAMVAKEKASAAEELAKAKASEVETAVEAVTQAERDAASLQEVADEAAKDAKERGCTGTFKLRLRGSDLPDTDGFMNMSDPFYEMFGAKG